MLLSCTTHVSQCHGHPPINTPHARERRRSVFCVIHSARVLTLQQVSLCNLNASCCTCCAQLSKSFFLELDRHLHEVLAPRLDELGMRRYGPAWPTAPDNCFPELQTPDSSAPPGLYCAEQQRRRSSAQEAWEGKAT